MVESEDDEQQQAEQHGDRAEQEQMRPYAAQAHEPAEPEQDDTAESSPIHSNPGIRGLASRIR